MALELLAETTEVYAKRLEPEDDIEGTAGVDSSFSSEDRIFRCEEEGCLREFSSKRNLVDHIRGHHCGEKPHVCGHPGCGKSFLRPAHLTIHYRIHTGEKPFICPIPHCRKRWNQKSALKQHMRSHTGEKPFQCPECLKRFSTSSSCKRHLTSHGFAGTSKKKTKMVPSSTLAEAIRADLLCVALNLSKEMEFLTVQ